MKLWSLDVRSEGQFGDSLLRETCELGGSILHFKTFNFEPPQVIPSFRQENILLRRRQLIGQCAPAWAGADDDNVGLGGHVG